MMFAGLGTDVADEGLVVYEGVFGGGRFQVQRPGPSPHHQPDELTTCGREVIVTISYCVDGVTLRSIEKDHPSPSLRILVDQQAEAESGLSCQDETRRGDRIPPTGVT